MLARSRVTRDDGSGAGTDRKFLLSQKAVGGSVSSTAQEHSVGQGSGATVENLVSSPAGSDSTGADTSRLTATMGNNERWRTKLAWLIFNHGCP